MSIQCLDRKRLLQAVPCRLLPVMGILLWTNGRIVAQDGQAAALDAVRLDQRLEQDIPLDLTFVDETGHNVVLRQFFEDQTVVLIPVYYRCPMLCTQVLSAVVRTVDAISLKAGSDFQVVVFSIDPKETPTLAGEKKLNYLRHLPTEQVRGWHFLTASQDAITSLTAAIGYHYQYDESTGQFAHPAAVVLLSPSGRIARYLLGLDYTPRDMRLALVETSQGRIGTVMDQVLLRCYSYDPQHGRYGFAILTALRIGGLLTVLAVILAIFCLGRRRQSAPVGDGGHS